MGKIDLELAMDRYLQQKRAALRALKARGDAQRAKNLEERREKEKEHQKAKKALRRGLHSLVQEASLAQYAQAVKGEIAMPPVVTALQAKLCLHVHMLCVHEITVNRTKKDGTSTIYWLEQVVQSLKKRRKTIAADLNQQIDQKLELLGGDTDSLEGSTGHHRASYTLPPMLQSLDSVGSVGGGLPLGLSGRPSPQPQIGNFFHMDSFRSIDEGGSNMNNSNGSQSVDLSIRDGFNTMKDSFRKNAMGLSSMRDSLRGSLQSVGKSLFGGSLLSDTSESSDKY